MAAVPNFLVLEFHHLDEPVWTGLINEGPLIEDGHITVPDAPSLAVTLNEDTIRANMRENLGFFRK